MHLVSQPPSMLDLQNGPSISLWLTLFGVVAGFLSTFWSFGYTRLSRRLYRYLSTGPDDNSKRVKKTDVLNTLMRGSWINVLGLGSTLLGLQATVGLLVAKTLTNATANPFLAGGAGSYNPVLALDVFLVQVSFNFACPLLELSVVLQLSKPKTQARKWLGITSARHFVLYDLGAHASVPITPVVIVSNCSFKAGNLGTECLITVMCQSTSSP